MGAAGRSREGARPAEEGWSEERSPACRQEAGAWQAEVQVQGEGEGQAEGQGEGACTRCCARGCAGQASEEICRERRALAGLIVRVTLFAVGQRMPGWVTEGFTEYTRRLKARLPIELVEIPAAKRGSGDVARAMHDEGKRMLAAIRPRDHVIALDERGKQHTSQELARWLARRLQSGEDLSFLIGGADGYAPEVAARAQERWSLSTLTLPHALVRVVFAEQLYRAVTLLDGHPYHRE